MTDAIMTLTCQASVHKCPNVKFAAALSVAHCADKILQQQHTQTARPNDRPPVTFSPSSSLSPLVARTATSCCRIRHTQEDDLYCTCGLDKVGLPGQHTETLGWCMQLHEDQ